MASSGSLEAHYGVVNNNDCLWLIYFLISFNQSVLTVTSALSNIQMLPVKIHVHICVVSRHMAGVYNLTFVFDDTSDHLILGEVAYVRKELELQCILSVFYGRAQQKKKNWFQILLASIFFYLLCFGLLSSNIVIFKC